MWIVTKFSGVLNGKHITRFYENSYGTHAYCYGASYLISDKPVLAIITEAMKTGATIVEVE